MLIVAPEFPLLRGRGQNSYILTYKTMYDNKKMLIVDDEENSRLYLANILLELYPKLYVQFASTPQEALFLISKNKFDTIFMDVEMPEMTGHELVKQIREQQNLTPVIFVSAFSNTTYLRNALRLSAVDYLDKPVNPKELETAVAMALSNRIHEVDANNDAGKKIKLFCEQGLLYFEPDEMLCFETKRNNSLAYFVNDNKKVIVRYNLTELIAILPAKIFVRVSRQFVVNIHKIKYISKSTKSIVLNYHREQLVIHKVYPEILKSDNKNI